jgi:hypothetical protein
VSLRAGFLLVVGAGGASAQDTASVRRETIGRLISAVEFGLPESPAFELLPDRPSEVVHVVTPKDFKSALGSWHDGSRLRVGAAIDARPLVRQGGSLEQYRRSWWRAAAFRTVFSAGTAAAVEGSRDVVLAAGFRVPLIDRGDPRADDSLNAALGAAYAMAITKLGQPPFDEPFSTFVARSMKASPALDSIRKAFSRAHWNDLKFEIGVAGSVQASSGRVVLDSIQAGRVGAWGALAVPVLEVGQLTLAGKAIWPSSDSAHTEKDRQSVGGRIRFFLDERLSLSGEFSRVWSGQESSSGPDQRWNHLALLAEWYVPELKGWLALAYGGDADRPGEDKDQLSLTYAFSRQRLIEPP